MCGLSVCCVFMKWLALFGFISIAGMVFIFPANCLYVRYVWNVCCCMCGIYGYGWYFQYVWYAGCFGVSGMFGISGMYGLCVSAVCLVCVVCLVFLVCMG